MLLRLHLLPHALEMPLSIEGSLFVLLTMHSLLTSPPPTLPRSLRLRKHTPRLGAFQAWNKWVGWSTQHLMG